MLHENARRFGDFARQGLHRFLRFLDEMRESEQDLGADVPADADRAQRPQPGLGAAFAAGVMKHLVLPAQHYIRHDLLPARIFLDLTARPVREVARV